MSLPPDSCFRFSISVLLICMSCKTRGLRVTMPEPLGRKSRPTRLSNTELLPELWKKKKTF